jgi:tight adherence protein C
MLYIALIIVFLTIYLALLGIMKIVFKERLTLLSRLGMFATAAQKKRDSIDEELSKPFFERAIRPLVLKLAQLTTRAMPAKKKVSIQKKLLMAGNPFDLTPNEFMAIQYAFMTGIPLISILITLPFGWPISKLALVAIGAIILGQFIPEYYLKMKSKSRQDEIQKALPDVLDLLTVSVEAGLGFDAALVKVVEKIKGVLSEEFSRVLQEIKMGKPKRDALRDLGFRTGVDDLTSFIGAIIQADQLGVSIGNVLRLQSEQMRIKRRQRAEEKAMKAPIKILIPLLFFIFPTIFIVLLGPALIQFLDTVS